MAEGQPSIRKTGRAALIAALVVLFSAGIAYSVLRVRYQIEGRKHSEGAVTELSLTHRVERDKDGKLSRVYYPGDERPKADVPKVEKPEPSGEPEAVKPSLPQAEPAKPRVSQPAPAREEAAGAQAPAPPRPEPQKAAQPKPRPKPKPEPKPELEPAQSPPGGGRACPT